MSTQTTAPETAETGERRAEAAPTERVTIIKESSSGSGFGLIAVLMVLALIAVVAFLWFGSQNKADHSIASAADAVTEASQSVGAAADKVGAAADTAADNIAAEAEGAANSVN